MESTNEQYPLSCLPLSLSLIFLIVVRSNVTSTARVIHELCANEGHFPWLACFNIQSSAQCNLSRPTHTQAVSGRRRRGDTLRWVSCLCVHSMNIYVIDMPSPSLPLSSSVISFPL